MNGFGCDKCRDLCATVVINLPADLEQVIDRVKGRFQSGVIVELKGQYGKSFEELLAEGWGDIVGHTFKCTGCGQKFSLSAETYHGSGGEWRRLGT